jgi:hypothetical protein
MDDASIVATLRQAAGSDSRELDRTCESVAAHLVGAGTEPVFEVRTADFEGDPFLICADRYWRLRFLAVPSVPTAAECARWLDEHVAAVARAEVEQKWSLGYAFITRDNVESRHELDEATGQLIERYEGAVDAAFFAALYHAGKLRSNYWFDELYQFLESAPLAVAVGRRRDEPVFVALRCVAAFGSRAITFERATELLEEAWTAPNRTRNVVDLCVQGIWASPPFHGQGELLRTRALEAVAEYPRDAVLRFRLAKGERLCGQHEAALDTIDTALRLLPAIGTRGSHKTLQDQFLYERDLILEDQRRTQRYAEMEQRYAEMRHRWEAQEASMAELRQTMRSATVRAVELVAVFTAAIAFSVGALQVSLSGQMPLGDRAWLIAALGAGLAIFALLVVGGTWLITGTHRDAR